DGRPGLADHAVPPLARAVGARARPASRLATGDRQRRRSGYDRLGLRCPTARSISAPPVALPCEPEDMTVHSQPLVVGLDGSDASLVALDWAAAEATRRNWPLRLVNAFPISAP